MSNRGENNKKLEGVVVGNKMDKTVRVVVEKPIRHPVYKKTVSRRKVFFAHSEEELELGTKVQIIESRPFSKNVRWLVVNK